MSANLAAVNFACPDKRCKKLVRVTVGVSEPYFLNQSGKLETHIETAVMNPEDHAKCSNAFESL